MSDRIQSNAQHTQLDSKPYFEVKNLHFFYGKFATLSRINTVFKKGEITALIGPSGSGKSTLLRTFNRIYDLYPGQHATGEILIDGLNILSDAIDVNMLRKKISMVFQKPTPFPMSIFENIAFAVRIHENLKKDQLSDRVEQALRDAAIWDEVKDKLHTPGTSLSGGQQQRLCIARTLAIKPEILLLDEPTSALDPISTAKIETLLKTLSNQYTIIIVTHNLKQAQRLSSSTIFMSEGQIIEQNTTTALFNTPQNPLTQHYIQND
ncbi:phosphate ABC transporter ATP-binding protein PstB [Thiotrichales bacterium 19S3-7]|nr:phosphate ABC transporter ATP-binding protein PstB [Thiotrichales bacterium 19S3-7]MCF6801664.1 phosphate ABC transporter ATP-binding protein PstB [Thiotrichales bacterium 19S3-11]